MVTLAYAYLTIMLIGLAAAVVSVYQHVAEPDPLEKGGFSVYVLPFFLALVWPITLVVVFAQDAHDRQKQKIERAQREAETEAAFRAREEELARARAEGERRAQEFREMLKRSAEVHRLMQSIRIEPSTRFERDEVL
jgi:2-polyprenyl-6-methoxyphenol hydroxylase-like FAD-dependent oxidoreductase